MGSALALLICLGGVGVGMAYNWRILTIVSALTGVILASGLIVKLLPILAIIVLVVWIAERRRRNADPFETYAYTGGAAADQEDQR